MIIRGTSAMLFIGGLILFIFAKLIPLLEYLSMNWIGVFMMTGGMFIILFCFGPSQTGLQYDTLPAGSSLINYIRRDGIVIPILGKRIFQGESFLDVPGVGIIEDFGKDCVFLWGRKKVRFAIENISYTPDLKYGNYCAELHKLGFDDIDEVTAIMNIDMMKYDTTEERNIKTYYLARMADIYHNLDHPEPRGSERLMNMFKEKAKKNTKFSGNLKKSYSRHTPKIEIEKQEQERTSEDIDRERLKRIIGEQS